MEHFKLRIKVNEMTVSVEVMLEMIPKQALEYASVFESHDTNPHYHFYLITDKKESAIRAQLRKIGKGNACWSLKQLDIDEKCICTKQYAIQYMAYMCKEGRPCWVGFCECSVDIAMKRSEEISSSISKKREDKKKSQLQLIQEYVNTKFEEHKQVWSLNCPPTAIYDQTNSLVHLVLQYYIDNDKQYDKFKIERMVTQLMVKNSPEARECFEKNITLNLQNLKK
jgi:hypothetical protein